HPVTGMGWPIVPDALLDLLRTLHRTCPGVPLYITENGCAFDDSVHDEERIDFLARHIDAVRAAVAEGVDVRGYFVWSLLDNFEWTESTVHSSVPLWSRPCPHNPQHLRSSPTCASRAGSAAVSQLRPPTTNTAPSFAISLSTNS